MIPTLNFRRADKSSILSHRLRTIRFLFQVLWFNSQHKDQVYSYSASVRQEGGGQISMTSAPFPRCCRCSAEGRFGVIGAEVGGFDLLL